MRGTGQQDAIAKQWADLMTEKYVELAQKEAVFAELQNVMDLCVVAALIQREDLIGLAGGNELCLLADVKVSVPTMDGTEDGSRRCAAS